MKLQLRLGSAVRSGDRKLVVDVEGEWKIVGVRGDGSKQTRRQDDVKWRIQVFEYRQGEGEKKAENNG